MCPSSQNRMTHVTCGLLAMLESCKDYFLKVEYIGLLWKPIEFGVPADAVQVSDAIWPHFYSHGGEDRFLFCS